MNLWDFNVNLRFVIMDMLYLSSFILIGTVIRRYIRFFQKFLVPNNFIAGIFALLIGSQGLNWIDLQSDRMVIYVYHFLALTFIALGLRSGKKDWGKGPLSKGFAALSSYLIQAIIGLSIALLLFYTIMPDLFVGIGLVVPLSFGMGPGLAATIAGSWEEYGFEGGSQVGLTFATIGYLYAFIIGMFLIQWGVRRGRTKFIQSIDHISDEMRTGVNKPGNYPSAGNLPLSTDAIEPMAFHFATVGFVYLITYFVVDFIATLFTNYGMEEIAVTIWGFHFIFGLIIALIIRKILDKTKRSYLIDKGLMTRSMGIFLDYLVVGAIAGISITVVGHYWLPILLICLVAGPATLFLLYFICYRAFDDYHFERFIELFGEMTGTINSALVLLRVVDSEFKSPVAEDAVYGSGISLLLGFPLLYILNIPFIHFNNEVKGYWVTLGLIIGYWLLLVLIWRSIGFIKFRKEK